MEKLTEAEWRQMLSLIRRYGLAMDQWDMFQLPTEAGSIYVSVTLAPSAGASESNRALDPDTGRELPG
jgi:hypothetical protein